MFGNEFSANNQHTIQTYALQTFTRADANRKTTLAKALLARLNHAPEIGSKDLKRLAGLGVFGKYPGKAHSELLDLLGEPDYVKPVSIELPIKVIKFVGNSVRRMAQQFFLPHVHFADSYKRDGLRQLLGNEDSPKHFWEGGVVSRQDPRLKDHSMLSRPDWMQRAIPYAIHGDAVPVTAVGKSGTRSCDIISSSSLFARGSSIDVKHMIYAIFLDNVAKLDIHGVDTMDGAWKVITWSLWFLFLGIWPTCDWNGHEWGTDCPAERALAGEWLAAGNFAVTWLLKGDLDYYAKNLHLRSYNANEPCDFCPCDKGKSQAWWPSNFATDAAWRSRCFNKDQWLALYPAGVPHVIFTLPFLSHYNVEPDELHVIYMGTCACLLGSVLFYLAFILLPDTAQQNLSAIWNMIQQLYSVLGVSCQYTNLVFSMFCDESAPDLKYPF
jgi:hypothetical protein